MSDAAGLHVGAMHQLLIRTLESPLRLGLKLGVGSDQGARDASGPRGIYVDNLDCPRPSSSCGSSELRVDGDGNRARAGDVRDSEDLDVDREHGSWEKIRAARLLVRRKPFKLHMPIPKKGS